MVSGQGDEHADLRGHDGPPGDGTGGTGDEAGEKYPRGPGNGENVAWKPSLKYKLYLLTGLKDCGQGHRVRSMIEDIVQEYDNELAVDPKYLKLSEILVRFGVSRDLIQKLVDDNCVKTIKAGKSAQSARYYNREDVEAALESLEE